METQADEDATITWLAGALPPWWPRARPVMVTLFAEHEGRIYAVAVEQARCSECGHLGTLDTFAIVEVDG